MVSLTLLIIVATQCLVSMSAKAQDQTNFVARIESVDSPEHVAKSEIFGIHVQVAYYFRKPGSLQVSIYNQENDRLATEYSGTVVDNGIAYFDHLFLTAPNGNTVWKLLVNLYFQNSSGGMMYYVEGRDISVIVGSRNVAAPNYTKPVTTTTYVEESTPSSYVAQLITTTHVEDSTTSALTATVSSRSTTSHKISFPLSLQDFSLWSAMTAIILLVTSELLSPDYGRTKIMINQRRLRIAALAATLVFLSTVAYRIFEILKP